MYPVADEKDVRRDRLPPTYDHTRRATRVDVFDDFGVRPNIDAHETGLDTQVPEILPTVALKNGGVKQGGTFATQTRVSAIPSEEEESRERFSLMPHVLLRNGAPLVGKLKPPAAPRTLPQHLLPNPPPEENLGRVAPERNVVPVRAQA